LLLSSFPTRRSSDLGFFFRSPADLTDHDNAPRLRILIEELDCIDEVRADDRISTDTDTGRLPDLPPRELANRFIRQSPAARHDAYMACKMNMSRHDSHLPLAG